MLLENSHRRLVLFFYIQYIEYVGILVYHSFFFQDFNLSSVIDKLSQIRRIMVLMWLQLWAHIIEKDSTNLIDLLQQQQHVLKFQPQSLLQIQWRLCLVMSQLLRCHQILRCHHKGKFRRQVPYHIPQHRDRRQPTPSCYFCTSYVRLVEKKRCKWTSEYEKF